MAPLTFEPLATTEAEAYWRLYMAGRTDLPTRSLQAHLDRYLALPPEEQRTHHAIRKDGRMIGTVRLLPDSIAGFSVDPAFSGDTKAAIIKAVDVLRSHGTRTVTASFDDTYVPAFEALGFRPVFARMRMEASTRRLPPPDMALQHPEEKEIVGLAAFFQGAYEGHIEQVFGMHVGSDADWRGYITGILRGESGRFMPDASFVSLGGERIEGAILVSHWMESPLVTELGVAKARRRQGLGRALLSAASTRLAALGEPTWALYVTVGNTAALALYEPFGFRSAGSRTVTARLDAPEA